MNYRALEDLIGILVKKAGSKLSNLAVEEDIDFLKEREAYLLGEISTLKSKLEANEYVNTYDRQRDEEENKYLSESLNSLNNSLADLDAKLSDKSIKTGPKRKLMGEKTLLLNEITEVKELLELSNLKLQNKAYFDESSRSKDEVTLAVLEQELVEVRKSLEEKNINPVLIGHRLLEAFKDEKPFTTVSDMFEILTSKARNEYERTTKEVKDSKIFELMDKYTTMKRDSSTSLENNNYSIDTIRQGLFEKEKYHNSRVETFKATLESIEKRKAELNTLIDESKKLYESVHRERQAKEDKLNSLVNVLYNELNLVVEEESYKKTVNDLRNEIADDKYLENKYDNDVQSFKDEVKNLDINYSNVNAEIAREERSLEIIHEKLSANAVDSLAKFEDKVNFLVYSNRIDSLVNEQQYLYVNVDVIKDEIISIWNKGEEGPNGGTRSSSTVKFGKNNPVVDVDVEDEPEVDEESVINEVTSMYDEVPETPVVSETPQVSDVNDDMDEAVEVIDYLE